MDFVDDVNEVWWAQLTEPSPSIAAADVVLRARSQRVGDAVARPCAEQRLGDSVNQSDLPVSALAEHHRATVP
ncbi:hypothetical protein [Brachybacterium vulturis]|uniref:hypothetical protein n=1 Tax=Brachybacterium vulturis TaxID=2017484 RepID=UPI003735D4A4